MRTKVESKEEQLAEITLRPHSFEEFFGQSSLIENLKVYIQATKKRKEALDHVLAYGPSGLGKTTLAHVIANELNQKITCVNGPTIEKIGDMASILSSLEPGEILFIDEIHRIPKVVEEFLYSAMEDFRINLVVSHEKDSENLSIDLPPFTVVGATTKISSLSWPIRQRFGIHLKFDFYKVEELEQIVIRSAQVLGDKIDPKAAHEIAIRSRGTPRIANRLLRRVRDFYTCSKQKTISEKLTIDSLKRINVDQIGLDELDIEYLSQMINRFHSKPVGLDTLASSFGEDPGTLEEVCEPYLISIGFINRTPRGREITEKGKTYFLKYHKDHIED